MIIKSTCPNCSANLDVDDSRDVFFCQYCGYKVINVQEKVEYVHSGTVTYKQDRSNEPNLYITYNSSDPTVSMVSTIPSLGYKNVYTNGTTQSFKVVPGTYKIVFKVGGLTQKVSKKQECSVTINSNNDPVRVNVNLVGTFIPKVFVNIN